MSSDEKGVVTAYKNAAPNKQEQNLPGLDSKMDPLAEHTKIEKWDRDGKPYLAEYRGSGKLEDKKILITGGDSGIGRSVAIFYAREGADLSIVYLPEEQDDAEKVKKAVEAEGRECLLIPFDLMNTEKIGEIVDKHLEKFKYLDVLVNNASKQIQCKDLADIDPENVKSTFSSNIISMIVLTKYALPHMKRGSCILNSTSVTAYKGSPAMIDYCTTKGAIVTFTRAMSQQLLPKGIRVNAIAPGPVYTPLQPASRTDEQMDDWSYGTGSLIHGRVAQPAELAGAYVFAASHEANCMTGAVVHVNNGQWVGS